MNPWILLSELVRTVLLMSATGSIVALLLFAFKPLLKNYLPKSTQYYLWVFVIIAFLVPFSLFASLPFNTPLSPLHEILEKKVKTTVERREELSRDQYGMEFVALDAQKQLDISLRQKGLVNGKFNDYFLLALVTLGCAGFIVDIYRYAVFAAKLRRKRINAETGEVALLRELCNNKACPRLYRNPLLSAPMTMGIFRPEIYLPDREYSNQQLRNILLHELVHCRRHDVLIKWIAASSVYVHWFNPVAYYVQREINRTCELACDEAVIKDFDNRGKQSYGYTLIEMSSNSKSHRLFLPTMMCEEKESLKERLYAIMKSKKHSKKAKIFSCVTLIMVLCLIVVLGASVNRHNAIDTLFFKLGNEISSVRPHRVIAEIDAGNDGTVIFYYNERNNLAFAIVERNLFGGYNIANIGAELAVESEFPASLMYGQYRKARKWRAWGILRDNNITRAAMHGQDAKIVEAEGLRFFYLIGDGEIPDEEFYFYDDTGNLVWTIY